MVYISANIFGPYDRRRDNSAAELCPKTMLRQPREASIGRGCRLERARISRLAKPASNGRYRVILAQRAGLLLVQPSHHASRVEDVAARQRHGKVASAHALHKGARRLRWSSRRVLLRERYRWTWQVGWAPRDRYSTALPSCRGGVVPSRGRRAAAPTRAPTRRG